MFRKTVRTKLMKKKMSLSALLHETIQRQWDEIKSQMFKFPYFDKWTDQMVHQCCVHSNILSFEENDLLKDLEMLKSKDPDDDQETTPEGILTAALDESLGAVQRLHKLRATIKDFPMFRDWKNAQINLLSYGSRIKRFSEGEAIPMKDDANVYVTYFILEGSATVVQRLVVEKYKLKGDKRYRYKLHTNQDLRPSERTTRTEFIFMQTCILKQGACFGLGEKLSDYTLKANKGLKCLAIPKHIIHQNFTPDNIWKRIILFLDMNYPSTEKVFEMFVAGREWQLNSKELNGRERFHRLFPLGTTVHDVPLTIRTDDIFLANKFKRAETDPYYLFGEKYKGEEKRGFRPSVIKMIDVKDLPDLREAEKKREEEVKALEEEEDKVKAAPAPIRRLEKKVSIAIETESVVASTSTTELDHTSTLENPTENDTKVEEEHPKIEAEPETHQHKDNQTDS